ncbi:MAG: UDP-N-acetylglucosamine 2-epimerase [Anaeromicrobium sp.]|jgi:GDP/UDP-N,N'-diacetylbacillosamine 2-epimerase (hydrolysing)|uniref:UDP-N-acetylglucosamine 2-epimerase n=1 Tax=Anaeromicrobium sp. TaxID=1929132 RepID=UPI0025F4187B|nr:UDP-N-acetylglucosamine 2-epimerase [Anaeromicrobium sp.]MCT4593964.1 UDP-N-acetylglucosamine 2-epimerase [Anaeromicrobium sp.]
MNRICVITGTRAEYGLLRPLIEKINEDDKLKLQLVVTGMHLSPEFGLTYKQIEEDGYKIDEKIEILLSSDTPIGISKSMGLTMISFSECYERLKPDMIVVLGDRYEIFAAVNAASVSKIPIAHLHGGETTEGAFDEAFRHAITKMSYIHFATTGEYRKRIIQLGEHPDRVFNVGAIGIENIKNMELLSRSEFEESIGFILGEKTILVTFHPVTLESNTSQKQFKNLLDAVDEVENLRIIFTKANSDTDGRIINKMIDDYVNKNKDKAIAFTSMGQLRYLSAMQYVDAVVGNSSSGIIEAPSFKVPTVNIGDRQKGRIQAKSTINCRPEKEEIFKTLDLAFSGAFKNKINDNVNPYGEGNVSIKIIQQIKKIFNQGIDLKKRFYDL